MIWEAWSLVRSMIPNASASWWIMHATMKLFYVPLQIAAFRRGCISLHELTQAGFCCVWNLKLFGLRMAAAAAASFFSLSFVRDSRSNERNNCLPSRSPCRWINKKLQNNMLAWNRASSMAWVGLFTHWGNWCLLRPCSSTGNLEWFASPKGLMFTVWGLLHCLWELVGRW